MKIRYRRTALADLADIRAFIAASNPHAARRVIAEIRGCIDKLLPFAEKYRVGPVEGTREIVVTKYGYIVTFRIEPAEIAIVAVFHAAQNIPRGG
jgi:toxin ParE1/3/4